MDIHPGFQKRHHDAADREDASRQASERRTDTDAFANGNCDTDPNRYTEPNTLYDTNGGSSDFCAYAIWQRSVRASQKGQKIEKGKIPLA